MSVARTAGVSQPQSDNADDRFAERAPQLTNEEAIMAAHRSSRLTRMRARIKRIWSELGYANRRMFDIRTGEHFMRDARRKDSRARTARRGAVAAR
jgi:hypothetical protein